MKNILLITLISLAGVTVISCNDDFLERYPQDALSDQTFWNTKNDLEVYVNGLYNYIDGFESGFTRNTMIFADNRSDNAAPVGFDRVAAGLHNVPEEASSGGWNWDYLRRCNYFLERYGLADIPEEDKNHYAGIVRLFRAWFYADKVKHFGDVPWIGKTINLDDPELFGSRDPRKMVMDSVLADLNFAVANIRTGNTGKNEFINKYTALALKARICLHEGTFRKYHQLGDHEKFLQEAQDAAKAVIESGVYQLYSTGQPDEDYHTLFGLLDLNGNSEVILSRVYIQGVVDHATTRYLRPLNNGLTKDIIDEYLCSDGLPPSLSSEYQGDDSLRLELQNRDARLLQTVAYYPDGGLWDGPPSAASQWPVPALRGEGPRFLTTTGYHFYKYYNPEVIDKFAQGDSDAPIIRYAEVLLIYAETCAELGECTQEVLDQTINLIRERVGMPSLTLTNLYTDPKLAEDYSTYADYMPSPLLMEIRRERRVELALEGFRYDDLMRWKLGNFMEKPVLGMQFNQNEHPGAVVGSDIYVNSNGFIDVYQDALPGGRIFEDEKHYYFPIPLQAIAQNPQLEQNPGW